MIEAEGLTKSFNGTKAVHNLTLNIKQGEVYCLLGANGAGKTTTIHLFLDFLKPDSGDALINGISVFSSPVETKKALTYIPENLALYPSLTGIENLAFFAGLGGEKQDEEFLIQCLSEAGLQQEACRKRVSRYSKGMRQKVGVALAIARNSKVLLLDEPTSGLDPAASNDFAMLMHRMMERGSAILMATHDLFRAKETGTRAGIMNKGVLVEEIYTHTVSHSDLEQLYLNHMKG